LNWTQKNKILILVTGGTGLLGSHLLYQLCLQGKGVRAIKRTNSNCESVKKVFAYYSTNAEALYQQIKWVDADLNDAYQLEEVLENIDYVFHAAATVSFEQKDVSTILKTNVEGTANLVNAALIKGVKKFCHVSSVAAIGRPEFADEIKEEFFWKANPDNSIYSISKYGAEREVWRASEEGLNVVIVNPSLIIGPGNWHRSTGNMFTKASKRIWFYTHGSSGFVDVRDVTQLMIMLIQSEIKNERFIISSQNISFKLFFEYIHKYFNKPLPPFYAGKLLSEFAWRFEKWRCLITGSVPLITRETAKSAHNQVRFSNSKISSLFPDFRFLPIEKSICDTCHLYLKDQE
jgi:dihydroflavonol-4-reductase